MRYSVWSYKDQQYRVYDDGKGHQSTHASSPPRSVMKSGLGATPEQASWTVPAGAKLVGLAPLPQGRIATPGGIAGLGLGDVAGSDGLKILGALGVVYFAFRSGTK